jgi:hypothetical protein
MHRRVEAFGLVAVHSVESISGLSATMLGHIVSQGSRVKPAPRHAKALTEILGRFKEIVRY